LENAKLAIEQHIGDIVECSNIYCSPAWGFNSDTDFLNQVLIVRCYDEADLLLAKILNIESQMGRRRYKVNGYSSRIIDIDILFFGNQILKTQSLEIPHPRLHLRKFTLLPLKELVSDFVHPVFEETISELLSKCLDSSEVRIFVP
jgi:2-amino-4-hydroxy-6-hydroxymethyldihydropteridine diphosphokinase